MTDGDHGKRNPPDASGAGALAPGGGSPLGPAGPLSVPVSRDDGIINRPVRAAIERAKHTSAELDIVRDNSGSPNQRVASDNPPELSPSGGHEHSGSTPFTVFDYLGLGFILEPPAVVVHAVMTGEPLKWSTAWDAVPFVVVGAIFIYTGRNWVTLKERTNRRVVEAVDKLSRSYLIPFFIMLCSLIGIAVLPIWIWPPAATEHAASNADEIASAVIKALAKNQQEQPIFVQPSDAIALCSDGPCAPVHLKPGPEYLKGISLGVGGAEPLLLNGTSAATTDRLRVFVDYSEYRSGWMEKTRAFIGEIKEPVKGQTEHLQLIYYQKDRPNAGANSLWWGEPSKEHPFTASTFDGNPLPAIIVRARLAIVGSNGEQHYYFILLRGGENIGTQVGVIPQHDSGDWIENWEKE